MGKNYDSVAFSFVSNGIIAKSDLVHQQKIWEVISLILSIFKLKKMSFSVMNYDGKDEYVSSDKLMEILKHREIEGFTGGKSRVKFGYEDHMIRVHYSKNKTGQLEMVFDRGSMQEAGMNLLEFTSDVYNLIKFSYGYVFAEDNSKEPFNYLLGIGSLNSLCDLFGSRNHLARIWIRNTNKIFEGYIRNVYEFNFLNDSQLNGVDGVSLKDFILKEKLGQLEKFKSGITLWRVQAEEVKKVRRRLRKYEGIIEVSGRYFDKSKFTM